jgi:arylsulfatase A-like enzyme/tetratricopeptide (TPR) repeat protein
MTVKIGKKTLVALGGGIVLLAAAFLAIKGRRAEPLEGNLLIITLDTTRADSLGAYGGEGNHTPRLDRLAREGIMFKNCVTPVPLTLPAHSSLFTGRTPLAHQVRNNARYVLAPEELTLAERLKPAGFTSYAVIASYVLLGRFGLDQGFDDFDDSLDTYKAMNSYNTEIPADAVSGRFLAWLDKNKEKKFFAWVHFYDPHEPYRPPQEYRPKSGDVDPKDLYLGEVEFMDRHVGRILDALESSGLLSKTLVVVVGDHGEAFAEHGERGHAVFCYEENLRVPLIFRHEKLRLDRAVVTERVSLVDILPTILELYGLERDGGLHGQSFASCLRPGGKAPARRPAYVESLYGFEEMGWAPLTGVIDGDLKLLSLPRPELYDLQSDPGEKENIYEARPALARQLKERLETFVSSHTEWRAGAARELTAEDLRQLRSLGYVSSGSRQRGDGRDPKDGVAVNARLDEFFSQASDAPSRDMEAALDGFLRDNGIDRDPPVLARLWRFYEKRKQWGEAARVLQEAAAASPDDVGTRMQLAWIYSIMNKPDQVIPLGLEILERDEANSVAHILMGDAHAALGHLDEAAVEMERAIGIEPGNVSLRIKYAEILIASKRFPEALGVYDTLLTNENVLRDHEFLFKLALFYAQNERDGQARQLIDRCCRLHPSGRYFFYRAVMEVRSGDYEAAKSSMKVALERYPDELTAEERAQAEKVAGLRPPGEPVP